MPMPGWKRPGCSRPSRDRAGAQEGAASEIEPELDKLETRFMELWTGLGSGPTGAQL